MTFSRRILLLAALVPAFACSDDGGGADAGSTSGGTTGATPTPDPSTTSATPSAVDSSTGGGVDSGSVDTSAGGVDSTSDGGSSSTGDDGETTGTESGDSTGEPAPPSGRLELDTILDTNAVVATKGMDVDADGNVFIWNYNQDNLERWDGATLETIATGGIVTGFGTDLAVDSDGDVVVSRGGSATGETLIKWNGTTGAPMWGPTGITIPGALLLGLTHATLDGTEYVFACDGTAIGGSIHRLAKADGSLLGSLPVHDVPLDVAVDSDENFYVLSSLSSNPVISGDPVQLRKYDALGAVVAGPVELVDALYITLGANGVLYVSSTDFDAPTRSILSFSSDLDEYPITHLPVEYSGFAGGIATMGTGDDLRILVNGQEGVGSGPICDVLVYREPD